MVAPEREPSKPLALVDWAAFVGCLLLLLWSAWTGQRAISFFAALLVVAGGIGRLLSRYALRRVSYERLLDEHRAFPGEQVSLTMRLTNRKLLPVAWMRVVDRVPAVLRPDSAHWLPAADSSDGVLSHLASLLWYRRITWRHKLVCRRRGLYTLGPARLSGGDAFGFFSRELQLPAVDLLIVYPRVLPIDRLGVLAQQPVGDLRAEQPIFEDPSRTVGIREYRSSDALKRIHWKVSARAQRLHVRVYEPTVTFQTMLVLGLEGFGAATPTEEDRFELAVSTVASLANHSVAQRHAVGLLINGGLPCRGDSLCLHPASGLDDLNRILELLAVVTPLPDRPLAELLLDQHPRLPLGAALVLVTGRVDDLLVESLCQLRRYGRRASLCAFDGDAARFRGCGVPVQEIVLGVPWEARQ